MKQETSAVVAPGVPGVPAKEVKEWSKMTKKERFAERLNRHYKSLNELLKVCGVEIDVAHRAKRISTQLLQIENICHRSAIDYCNGIIDMNQFDRICEIQEAKVNKIFCGKLEGFFINGDPRGYSLKIKDNVMREKYNETGLHKDWGGYGILAPEINGDY